MTTKRTWAIIGGGNGGQSACGHLGILGVNVRLYDIDENTVNIINEQGGINVSGKVNGFGKVEFATTDIGKAMKGADVVMVVAPALVHKIIAKNMAPHLEDNQIVFVHPGATFGALEFRHIFDEQKVDKKIYICESMSLVYACRLSSPGNVSIFGIKENLLTAVLPANETNRVMPILNEAYETLVPAKNVLKTSLENLNTAVHSGPTLLNTSLIESKHDWLYYCEGITPTIGKFAMGVDAERIEIGKAMDIELSGVMEWYKTLYNVEGETLTDVVRSNEAYHGIKGQKTMETRYLLEDIPLGIIPMISIAEKFGVKVERMETIVKLAQFLLEKDLYKNARTMKSLGLENMDKDQILSYVETGVSA